MTTSAGEVGIRRRMYGLAFPTKELVEGYAADG